MSKEYIQEKSKEYKKLKPCFCPAIGEEIHFTADGLHHLKYKKRRPRKHKDVHYRMTLIEYIPYVLEKATVATKELDKGKPRNVLWSLEATVDGKIIKVILRQQGNGKIHFFSVMQKNKKKDIMPLFFVPIAHIRILCEGGACAHRLSYIYIIFSYRASTFYS